MRDRTVWRGLKHSGPETTTRSRGLTETRRCPTRLCSEHLILKINGTVQTRSSSRQLATPILIMPASAHIPAFRRLWDGLSTSGSGAGVTMSRDAALRKYVKYTRGQKNLQSNFSSINLPSDIS